VAIRRELDTSTNIVRVAGIRIPEEYRPGFAALRVLGKNQARELLSALAGVQPARRLDSFYAKVASEVKGIEWTELYDILNVLISLFGLRDDMNVTTPEFVRTIASAMERSGAEDLAFADDGERASFEATLTGLLETEPLEVAAKALSLVYEQDHIVHGDFRVLTDMRPVFSSRPEGPSMQGAMVTHTLRFEYHDGSELRELFVALNARQVDQLAEVLDRAKLKAGEIRRFLEDSPISYVESE